MAKRKAAPRKRTSPARRKSTKTAAKGKRAPKRAAKKPAPKLRKKAAPAPAKRSGPDAARLNRTRRTLDETVPTPPSSLNLDRRGSAVRTGRAETAQRQQLHKGMAGAITGGDVDVDIEDAYFTGEQAPGGDNPTPDQDIVDDIGKALGVEYQDNEELKAVDKVAERDRKRWELDPASSEDYKDRK